MTANPTTPDPREALREAAKGLLDALDNGTDARDWHARLKDALAQPAPVRKVGDSQFESWYADNYRHIAHEGTKHVARIIYEAGMNDPVRGGEDAVRDFMEVIESQRRELAQKTELTSYQAARIRGLEARLAAPAGDGAVARSTFLLALGDGIASPLEIVHRVDRNDGSAYVVLGMRDAPAAPPAGRVPEGRLPFDIVEAKGIPEGCALITQNGKPVAAIVGIAARPDAAQEDQA